MKILLKSHHKDTIRHLKSGKVGPVRPYDDKVIKKPEPQRFEHTNLEKAAPREYAASSKNAHYTPERIVALTATEDGRKTLKRDEVNPAATLARAHERNPHIFAHGGHGVSDEPRVPKGQKHGGEWTKASAPAKAKKETPTPTKAVVVKTKKEDTTTEWKKPTGLVESWTDLSLDSAIDRIIPWAESKNKIGVLFEQEGHLCLTKYLPYTDVDYYSVWPGGLVEKHASNGRNKKYTDSVYRQGEKRSARDRAIISRIESDKAAYQNAYDDAKTNGKWPDGRKFAEVGDEVFQTTAGMFGMGATFTGVVAQGRGGLRVRNIRSHSLIGGNTSVGGKTMAYNATWTVSNDPELDRRKQKATEDADARHASDAKKQAELAKQVNDDRAKYVHLDEVQKKVGMRVLSRGNFGEDYLYTVTKVRDGVPYGFIDGISAAKRKVQGPGYIRYGIVLDANDKPVLRKPLKKGIVFALGAFAKNHKLHYRTEFQGLPISIENRKGSIRRGKGWATKMFHPYGYITAGTSKDTPDGDCLDCFIGTNKDATTVYVISQMHYLTGKFDEYDCMLGFDSEIAARDAFLAHYDDHRYLGPIEAMTMPEFLQRFNLPAPPVKKVTERMARKVGNALGVDWEAIPIEQLRRGMESEQEHADMNGTGNLDAAARIALAHLREIPDYYTRLKKMEDAAPVAKSHVKALMFFKSHVREHKRRLPSGRVIVVRAHEDRRTRRPEEAREPVAPSSQFTVGQRVTAQSLKPITDTVAKDDDEKEAKRGAKEAKRGAAGRRMDEEANSLPELDVHTRVQVLAEDHEWLDGVLVGYDRDRNAHVQLDDGRSFHITRDHVRAPEPWHIPVADTDDIDGHTELANAIKNVIQTAPFKNSWYRLPLSREAKKYDSLQHAYSETTLTGDMIDLAQQLDTARKALSSVEKQWLTALRESYRDHVRATDLWHIPVADTDDIDGHTDLFNAIKNVIETAPFKNSWYRLPLSREAEKYDSLQNALSETTFAGDIIDLSQQLDTARKALSSVEKQWLTVLKAAYRNSETKLGVARISQGPASGIVTTGKKPKCNMMHSTPAPTGLNYTSIGLPDGQPGIDEVEAAIFAGIPDGWTVKSTLESRGRGQLIVRGVGRDEKGNFAFSRTFVITKVDGRIDMSREYFEVTKRYQGTGIGKASDASIRDLAQQIANRTGKKVKIRIHANLEVGGYAWAKAGYDFVDDSDRRQLARRFKRMLYNYFENHMVGLPRPETMPQRSTSPIVDWMESRVDALVRSKAPAKAFATFGDDWGDNMNVVPGTAYDQPAPTAASLPLEGGMRVRTSDGKNGVITEVKSYKRGKQDALKYTVRMDNGAVKKWNGDDLTRSPMHFGKVAMLGSEWMAIMAVDPEEKGGKKK